MRGNQPFKLATTKVEMKVFCKDCRWIRMVEGAGFVSATCGHENAERGIDLVTGLRIQSWGCKAERSQKIAGACGPKGLNFEPAKKDSHTRGS